MATIEAIGLTPLRASAMSDVAPKMPAGRLQIYPLIDVLRGFAALSVVVYHVIAHFDWTDFPSDGLLVWFRIGWMGVDLFFVISGVVISLSAFALIDKMGGSFHREFAERRLRRIVPLHYLTCFVFLVFVTPEILGAFNAKMNIFSHLGFFHNLSTNFAGAINGPNWSVAVEVQFYLLILILAPVLRTCRWWLIPAVALPIAWAWRYGAFAMVPIDGTVGPYFRFWASTQLPGTLDQFAAGVLLARFLRWGGPERLFPALSPALRATFAVAAASVLIWIMLQVFWPRASFWDLAGMVVFWRTFAAFAFAAVILAACTLNFAGLIRWTAPLRYLGTISYGIYLWHLSVILSLKRAGLFQSQSALIAVLVCTLILAIGSWHLFEKPLLVRRKKAI